MMRAFRVRTSKSHKDRVINAVWVSLFAWGIIYTASAKSIAQTSAAMGAAMSDKTTVTLEAKIATQLQDLIVITYSVKNSRPNRIYLFNMLYHADVQGNRTPDPELAYVLPGEEAITVGKFLVPIPAGMKAESPEMPYLDAVEPGQTLAGKISLKRPLRSFHPYYTSNDTDPPLEAKKLLVQFGILDPARAAPKDALIEPAKGAGLGHFQCDYGLGLKYQEILKQEITL
jgi:hypothetical protein